MERFTIISCYTKNNEFSSYGTEANLLKESMTQFDLDTSHINEYKDTGLWSWNTHYKIKFIKQKLEELKSPVVWTDADSRVKKYPEIFNNLQNWDFAANFRKKKHKELLNSGTMFFNNNDRVINMLHNWIDENNKLAEKSKTNNVMNSKLFCDQTSMRFLLKNVEFTNKLKIYKLSDSYYRVRDGIYKSEFYDKYKNIETIIEHTQASLRLKIKRRQQLTAWKSSQ